MGLTINNMIVEVTRRCNMRCDHCLRGDAQRLDMSDEVIAAMFRGVSHISEVTFTGGEPTLAVPVIEKIIAEARRAGVSIGNFYVITNGKTSAKTARRFALALVDLYADLTDVDPEEGLTGLIVSGDPYHEPVDIPKVYKGLRFFRDGERHGPPSEAAVIRTGRAELSGIGARVPFRLGPFEVSEYGEDTSVDSVYVAANGNVVADCNHSYAEIDAEARGNVLREPLGDIVRRDLISQED